jgi:hypothetical protein
MVALLALMEVIYFGALLVVAAVVAMVGQFLTGYSRGGCPVSFIVATFGGFVGPAAARELGIDEPLFVRLGEVQFPLITSAAAGLLLVILVNLLTKRRKF